MTSIFIIFGFFYADNNIITTFLPFCSLCRFYCSFFPSNLLKFSGFGAHFFTLYAYNPTTSPYVPYFSSIFNCFSILRSFEFLFLAFPKLNVLFPYRCNLYRNEQIQISSSKCTKIMDKIVGNGFIRSCIRRFAEHIIFVHIFKFAHL